MTAFFQSENQTVQCCLPEAQQGRQLEPGENGLNRWQQLALCSTEAARSVLSYEIARRFTALPVALINASGDEPLLSMLVPEAPDPEIAKSLRFACGLQIVVECAPRNVLEKAIDCAYLGGDTALISRLQSAQSRIKIASSDLNGPAEITGAVPELLEAILHFALARRASDIHIEPLNHLLNPGYSTVRFRIDGTLVPNDQLEMTREVTAELFRRIKVLASLDTTTIHSPLDGALTFRFGRGTGFRSSESEMIRMRVSFVPLVSGEKLVLRILENHLLESMVTPVTPLAGVTGLTGQAGLAGRSELQPFTRIGLTPQQEQIFRLCLASDRGAILLSGPTGSGKSTLLSLALNTLQSPRKTIVAIEDPVERCIANVTHLEVDRRRGLDYQQLLIAILRQDPDVLMIGEIRELSTAATALDAALTGKLVLSTIHAATVFEVLFRLLEMGISRELLSVALRCLSSQRLVPLACPGCKSTRHPGPGLQRIFGLPTAAEIVRSAGCEQCGFTGIAGRTGVFEILPITERIRDTLCEASTDLLRSVMRLQRTLLSAARDEGYQPLVVGIRRMLLDGLISAEAALAAAGFSADIFGPEFQP